MTLIYDLTLKMIKLIYDLILDSTAFSLFIVYIQSEMQHYWFKHCQLFSMCFSIIRYFVYLTSCIMSLIVYYAIAFAYLQWNVYQLLLWSSLIYVSILVCLTKNIQNFYSRPLSSDNIIYDNHRKAVSLLTLTTLCRSDKVNKVGKTPLTPPAKSQLRFIEHDHNYLAEINHSDLGPSGDHLDLGLELGNIVTAQSLLMLITFKCSRWVSENDILEIITLKKINISYCHLHALGLGCKNCVDVVKDNKFASLSESILFLVVIFIT